MHAECGCIFCGNLYKWRSKDRKICGREKMKHRALLFGILISGFLFVISQGCQNSPPAPSTEASPPQTLLPTFTPTIPRRTPTQPKATLSPTPTQDENPPTPTACDPNTNDSRYNNAHATTGFCRAVPTGNYATLFICRRNHDIQGRICVPLCL